MSQPNSEVWQVDEQSQEDEIFPNVQVESAEDPFDMFGSGSDEEYSLRTPEQKLTSQKKSDSKENTSESYQNCGNGSSDISVKEGSEAMSSSSSSSSDTEFVTCLPLQKYAGRHVNSGDVLQPKMIEIDSDTFDMKENLHTSEINGEAMLKEKDMLYEKLLEKVTNYEAELKVARIKIQASDNEIGKLKYENLILAEEVGGTIEKLRISEKNMKEMEIRFRNELKEGEELFDAKIDLANQSINLLQIELCSERKRGSEQQEMLANYSREVDELKLALHDAEKEFSNGKSQFQSEIDILQEQNDVLKTRLNEAEMRNGILEKQIKQHEDEKIEFDKCYVLQRAMFLDQIQQCEMDLSEKTHRVESLNTSLDSSKLKFDVLMSEKDEIFAKVETLCAEVSSRDINIQQLEGHISKLIAEQKDLVEKSLKAEKLTEELSFKLMEHKEELEKQRVSICDRADEKREAIKQLCFALEYYRTEYHDLRQVLLKHKRPVVMVS